MATSCSDDRPTQMDFSLPYGSSASSISMDITGGEASFTVNTTESWSATVDNAEWLTLSAYSGGAGESTLTIRAEPFDVYSNASRSRIGFITFNCGDISRSIAVVQTAAGQSDADSKQTTIKMRRRGGSATLDLPQAAMVYNVVIPEEASSWLAVESQEPGKAVLTVTENATDASRAATVKVTSSNGTTEIAEFRIDQSWRNIEPGEFLIEEIFFTGTPLPSAGVPNSKNKDQYFKITNNTDEILYADGLLIIESKNANAGKTWKEFIRPIINDYCEAGCVMAIPGNGTDVPVAPGKSLVIASNALNYREGYQDGKSDMKVEMNPIGLDLSKADFEWYTMSTNSVLDIDVPEVPNLDVWFCYTLSIYILHDRGFQSYALAIPPATVGKQDFINNYVWDDADYVDHTLAGDFEMKLTNVYKVPNEWIIDAVMCTVPSINQTRQFSPTLDSGWTWATPQNIDADKQRYGLSVQRRRDSATGRLIDTNNSLNDFIPNSTPSLR